MAQKVLEYPSRILSLKQIEELNKELELLTHETATTTNKFELKNKQFQLFLYALHQLQSQEEEDEKTLGESNNIVPGTNINTTTTEVASSVDVEKLLEKPDKMEADEMTDIG